MARAPLVLPALALLAGIAADAHGLHAVAAALAIGALAYRRTRIVGVFLLAGMLLALWRGHPPMIERESRTARFAGTVIGDVRAGDFGATFPFALDTGVVVRATVHGAAPQPGARLLVRGRLVPFDEPRNPGEPSARAIGLGEGFAGELVGDRIIAAAPPAPLDARAWPARIRAALSARLRSSVHEPEATVLAGALWGERGMLPGTLRDDFQATGTVHVLVTAGLHLGVIAALAIALLHLARIPRVAASLAAIPCVLFYAWLSGAHLPSQRAATMVCVGLLARACGARLLSWNALALAAIVIATLWPAAIESVSFALSFSCVAAILLFAGQLQNAFERWELPERVREALALTVATQIGVWPLSAATFGVLAPYAVLANAVVVPATGIAMLAGIATLAFGALPIAGRAAATIATWDVDAILRVVGAVAALPGARVAIAQPPMFAILAYDVVALLAAVMLRRSRRIGIALLALASAAVLVATLRLPDGKLRITVLDVGQGDGIVVRTPRGHVVLIDTGGRLENARDPNGPSAAEAVGERIVLGYLKREAIRHIDLLVITHPHGDHAGGCPSIVRALQVDALAMNGQAYDGRAWRDCLAAARERRVPITVVRRGMRYTTGDGVTFDALAPEEPLFTVANDVNENSIVLMLQYQCASCSRSFRMLFTGDAGAESEGRMLARGIDLEADVLKVGHHGSRYASSARFVAAVGPQAAIISLGRHNHFGHPAPSTLETLTTAGVTIYRTDRCAATTVAVDATVRVTPLLACPPR